MLGQFKQGKADDPVTFVTSVAAVLARYPREIVLLVSDPRTGLALLYDWLPSIRQVADECDRHAAKSAAAIGRERIIEATLADRKRYEEAVPPRSRPQELVGKPLRCNLLYRPESAGYAAIVERATKEPNDVWRVPGGGIWVPIDWHRQFA